MYRVDRYPQIKNNFFLTGRDVGASRKLRGKVSYITIFMNQKKAPWSESDRNAYFAAANKAAKWLKEEAARYGTDLEIEGYHYEMDCADDVDEHDDFYLVKDFLGAENITQAQNELEQSLRCNEAPFLLAFNTKGRGFAAKQRSCDSSYINEISVIFRGFASFSWSTIAHELLHQFGAIDYYFPESVKETAKRHIRDSIMGVGDNKVDDLTAYLVGWKDTISAESYWFLNETMWLTKETYYEELSKEWNS